MSLFIQYVVVIKLDWHVLNAIYETLVIAITIMYTIGISSSNWLLYSSLNIYCRLFLPSLDSKQIPVCHYDDVIMTMLASQITSLMVVYSIVYSGVNQRKHQSSASLALVQEIHRGPVNFPHKWPVTRKMFPFDDVIMHSGYREHYICNREWKHIHWIYWFFRS